MYRFLKVNDPLLALVIAFFLLVIGCIAIAPTAGLTTEELYLLTDARLIQKGYNPFTEIYDIHSPMAMSVMAFVYACCFQHIVVLRVLAVLCIIIQAFYLNVIVARHELLKENNYLLMWIYGLLGLSFFHFRELSPMLISVFPLLFGLDNLFKALRKNSPDDVYLKIGLGIGLSGLLFPPAYIFSVMVFISFFFASGANIRRNIIFAIGLLLPLGVTAGIVSLTQDVSVFAEHFFYFTRFSHFQGNIHFSYLYILSGVVLGFPFMVLLQFFYITRMVYNETAGLRVFLLFALCVIGIYLVLPGKPYQIFYLLVPCGAFFARHLLQAVHKSMPNVLMWGLLISVTITGIGIPFGLAKDEVKLYQDGYFTKVTESSKTVACLAPEPYAFAAHTPANGIVCYSILAEVFSHPEQTEKLFAAYQVFRQPDVVYDPNGVFAKLRPQVPAWQQYRSVSGGYWQKP